MTRGKIGLMVAAAAAAYGAYRYSKMTPDQRNGIKTKARDFLNKNVSGVKNIFNRQNGEVNVPN